MENKQPIRVKTITELHRHMEFPKPVHPLISIIDYAQAKDAPGISAIFDFYSISVKRGVDKLFYGQQSYDFDEGVMACIAQLELLFTYAQRFYERQFITRKISNSKILDRLEEVLSDYFNNEDLLAKGLPTVQSIAKTLNISTKYLSSLLKQLTGQSMQLIEELLINC